MANFFTQWVGTTLTCLQKSMSVGKKFEELKNYFCGTSWGVQSEHNGWGEKTCSAKKNYFLWQHLWSGITVGGEVLMIWAQRAGGPCLVIIFYHCCLYHCNHNQHNCHCLVFSLSFIIVVFVIVTIINIIDIVIVLSLSFIIIVFIIVQLPSSPQCIVFIITIISKREKLCCCKISEKIRWSDSTG